MNTRDRKIILKLNEHDASRLLGLIREEINQSDQIWRSYWERLAQNIEQSIERSTADFVRGSTCFKDVSTK